jgi:hypothetical protein
VVLSREPGGLALFFGFPSHDHAVVAFLGCGMDRVGAHPQVASIARTPGAPPPAAAATPASVPAGNAVLQFNVGYSAPGSFQPLAAAHIWVTPEDPAATLAKGGYAPPPGGTALARIAAGCATPQDCNRVFYAMTGNAADSVRTDPAGHAQTKPIPPGRYYLVGVVPYQAKAMVWAQAINLQPGSNGVFLDQTNGAVVH